MYITKDKVNNMPNDIPIFLNVEVNGVVGVDSVLEVDGVEVEGVLGAAYWCCSGGVAGSGRVEESGNWGYEMQNLISEL